MTTTIRSYPEYRDCGLPWLGRIPAHWSIRKLRHCGAIVGGSTPSMSRPDFWNGQIPWVSPKDMKTPEIRDSIDRITDAALSETSIQAIDPPAVLIVVRGMILARRVPIAVTRVRVTVNQDMKAILPSPNMNAQFLLYAMEASKDSLSELIDEAGHGTKRLPTERWREMSICCPPSDEQAAIVRFLDHADQKNRRFIQAKRRLIELLNEQKQALVSSVVMGSLIEGGFSYSGESQSSPNLGERESWKLGHFCRIGNGSTPARGNPNYWSEGTYPWLNSSTVNQNIITSSNQFVTSQALKECHLPIVPPGSVLVAITGQGKTRGTSALLAFEATINQHVAYITIKNPIITSNYLHLVLTGSYKALRAISDDSGSTKGALTCGQLRHLTVPVPPLVKQRQFVESVSAFTKQIDESSKQVQAEIRLTQEYRTRFIADVVTGKLDVREAAERLPSSVEQVAPDDDLLGLSIPDSEETDDLDDDAPELLPVASDED